MPPKVQSQFRDLPDRADLNDAAQNTERSRLLRGIREPILREIPADAQYRHTLIEETDLGALFVITSWDWFLDTGRTFALTDTLRHLRSGRGGRVGRFQSIDHRRLVEEKLQYLQDYEAERTDEHLILVATEERGPFTIIDGTHRAAALLSEHQQRPTIPWKAILIDSSSMAGNHWHIGFTGASQKLAQLGRLVDQGHIW